MTELTDELDQEVAWRQRLIDAIVTRKFDDNTLLEIILQGLRQAHSEGLTDAAYVCEKVANTYNGDGQIKRTAAILALQIRRLDAMNRSAIDT